METFAPRFLSIVTRDLTPQMTEAERRAFIATSRIAWGITIGAALFCAAVVWLTPLGFEWDKIPLPAVAAGILALISLAYTYLRSDALILTVSDCLAIMCLFLLLGSVSCYVAIYLGSGFALWDERFAAADRALGLDWRGYLEWMNARPVLGQFLQMAYHSDQQQALMVVLLLAALGQHRRLQIFVIAGQIGLLITALTSAFMPAVGSYWYLNISREMDHPNLSLAVMNSPVQQFLSLREGVPIIPFEHMVGLISFPSFHTSIALFFIWGFWSVPFVRWMALVINAAMLAATPLWGSHYFADMLAGVPVAIISIALASWLRQAPMHGEAFHFRARR